ncbi:MULTISPECIES: hypothetical protein [Vibrio]|uniref:hypothetical protein n=1 Tax=Vibrio TaxID=662 RepID=UPI001483AAE4|nr:MULTISPECIES: hypothetical protein [Vibrio]MDQ2166274.1 hypothetical protein [Vibrio anguillarum]NNN97678.1 hypothetical protein [Vibrio sp. B4-6]
MLAKTEIANVQKQMINKQFDDMSVNPRYWQNKSRDLFRSARVLWKAMKEDSSLSVSCYATYKMLMGMSFEALLKGLLIASQEVAISDLATHNLVELAKDSGLNLTKNENKIFTVLTDYILWAGKYPIPKNSSQLQQHRTTTSVTEQRKVKFGDLDVNEPNGALDFDNLKPVWLKISKMY